MPKQSVPDRFNDPIDQVLTHLWDIALDYSMLDAHRYRTIRCAIQYLSELELFVRKVGRDA